MTQHPRHATDRLVEALRQRGYRTLARYEVQEGQQTQEFRIYTNGRTILCLQVYTDGGCERSRPVTESLGIEATIAAIPE